MVKGARATAAANLRAHLHRWVPEASLRRQFTALAFANLFIAFTSFVSLVILARALSVDELGRIVFARAATAALFALFDPRVEDSLLRFFPIVYRDSGGRAASRLLERSLQLDQAVNIAIGGLGIALLFSGLFPTSDGIADRTLLAWATLQMAAQGAVGTMGAGYALTDGLARWGLLQTASTLVFTAASLAGLAASGAVGFLAAGAVTNMLISTALWFATVNRTRHAYGPPAKARLRLPSGFISFTLQAAFNSSVLLGAEAVPLIVVGFRSNASTLASFRVALGPSRLAAALVTPVSAIVYPRASRAAAAQQPASAAAEALRFTRRFAPVAFLIFGVGAIVMPSAMALAFGESFRSSSTTAIALLASALVRGSVAWAKTLPLALGEVTRRLVVSAIDVVMVVTAAALLADTPHAIGVALAYVGISLVVAAYWLNYAHRRGSSSFSPE